MLFDLSRFPSRSAYLSGSYMSPSTQLQIVVGTTLAAIAHQLLCFLNYESYINYDLRSGNIYRKIT